MTPRLGGHHDQGGSEARIGKATEHLAEYQPGPFGLTGRHVGVGEEQRHLHVPGQPTVKRRQFHGRRRRVPGLTVGASQRDRERAIPGSTPRRPPQPEAGLVGPLGFEQQQAVGCLSLAVVGGQLDRARQIRQRPLDIAARLPELCSCHPGECRLAVALDEFVEGRACRAGIGILDGAGVHQLLEGREIERARDQRLGHDEVASRLEAPRILLEGLSSRLHGRLRLPALQEDPRQTLVDARIGSGLRSPVTEDRLGLGRHERGQSEPQAPLGRHGPRPLTRRLLRRSRIPEGQVRAHEPQPGLAERGISLHRAGVSVASLGMLPLGGMEGCDPHVRPRVVRLHAQRRFVGPARLVGHDQGPTQQVMRVGIGGVRLHPLLLPLHGQRGPARRQVHVDEQLLRIQRIGPGIGVFPSDDERRIEFALPQELLGTALGQRLRGADGEQHRHHDGCYAARTMTRTCHRTLVYLVSLGILSHSNPASADELPSVGVVGLHVAGLDVADQHRAIDALSEAIEQSGRAVVLGPTEMARALRGREEVVLADGLLGPGRRLLADGRHLYNQAQPEEALPVLQRAIRSLELGQAAAQDIRDLWEAFIYLGTALQALEREEEAREAFGRAAALHPARSPNPALFPPSVLDAWKTARDALQAQAVPLRIEVPGQELILLDGVEVGRGSTTVEGVLPGVHHLTARGDGMAAYQRLTIDVPAEGEANDGPVEVRLNPGPPLLGRAAESNTARAHQAGALYRALGEHARGVDLLLLAGSTTDMMHFQLYAPGTDSFGRPLEVPLDGPLAATAQQALPSLFETVAPDGSLSAEHTSPLAVPLDVGANVALATLLTSPSRAPQSPAPVAAKRGPRVLPVVLGVVGAAALGSGTWYGVKALTGDDGSRYHGTIRIGPYR